jgi:cysteine desulfurase
VNLINLDTSSTTPLHPAVLEAMHPYWGDVAGNPASAHQLGRRARQALEAARERVAALLGAASGEVVFTSGGTEANNLALFGLPGRRAGVLVASPVEHPSVAEPLNELARRGAGLRFLDVTAQGVVRPQSLDALAAEEVRLVTVMLANNETGAVQPVADLAARARAIWPAAAFHCDAVQAAGKVPVDFHALGVTSLSLSAHKFHGPRGVGALLLRDGARISPLLFGGHQQDGRRPGTEPVVLAVGLARALELACQQQADRLARVWTLRRALWAGLERRAAPVVLNGPPEDGLPHILNVSFPGCDAQALLIALDLAGVACSTGSACSSGSLLPSPVLRAMGCPKDVLTSAMRFSLDAGLTSEVIDEAVRRISHCVSHLRTEAREED